MFLTDARSYVYFILSPLLKLKFLKLKNEIRESYLILNCKTHLLVLKCCQVYQWKVRGKELWSVL